MRAAMIKASCDQQQAEIDFKTKLEAHYKEKFDELEASYKTKLKEAKTWKWCSLCGEKAELYCCQNNSYCSNACMRKHKKETETEYTDQTECYSSVSPCHSSVV
uniref:ZMYND11/ZMYD8 MYND zinc finger domain-containing protein n=1 Tax=Ciona savignyi TaxID=51511 RepID=H2ZN67_CIOSA